LLFVRGDGYLIGADAHHDPTETVGTFGTRETALRARGLL